MKKIIILSIFTAFFSEAFSQADFKEAQKYITVTDGKKVLKMPDPQFMPYLALKFRTGTSKTEGTGEGQRHQDATAYAILDGVDSTVFQEITNEVYKHFTEKLKSVGVLYSDMSKIKASKGFARFSEEQEERHFNHKKYGTADIFTPDNVPFFKYPAIVTKVVKWGDELDAALSTLRLTVNFVEFDLDLSQEGVFTVTTTAKAKASAAVKIECIFQEALGDAAMSGGMPNWPGFTMMNNKNYHTARFENKTIYEPFKAEITSYDSKTPKFAGRKFRMFGGETGGMQVGTFIITVDPQEYKRAVLKAMDRYADYVTAIIKSYNEDKKK